VHQGRNSLRNKQLMYSADLAHMLTRAVMSEQRAQLVQRVCIPIHETLISNEISYTNS